MFSSSSIVPCNLTVQSPAVRCKRHLKLERFGATPTHMKLADGKLAGFLKKNGKRTEWLAGQLDCSLSTANQLLAGKVPKGEMLIQLARLMGCQAEDLIAPDNADNAEKRSA
jgi:hypothetical protein